MLDVFTGHRPASGWLQSAAQPTSRHHTADRDPTISGSFLGIWKYQSDSHTDFSAGRTGVLVSIADIQQSDFPLLFISASYSGSIAKSPSCSTTCISSGFRWIHRRIRCVKNGFLSLQLPNHCLWVQVHFQFLQNIDRFDLVRAQHSCNWGV